MAVRPLGGRERGCGLQCDEGCACSGGWLMKDGENFGRGMIEMGKMKLMS